MAARARGLADTGALLALVHREDAWHRPCAEAFASLRLPLATSAAALAELFHMVGDDRRAVTAAWRIVRSGALVVFPVEDQDLPALEALMKKYAGRPMDFADATLVHMAERESLTTVFTIDHDDFEAYRIGGRRRFRIAPERRAP